MRISVLLENKGISEDFDYKHGLSFYIESGEYKILSDLGDNDFFLLNAEKLGVDISEVEYVVISHGHGDHGGGLDEFIKSNSVGKAYVRENAFNELFSKQGDDFRSVGLNETLYDHDQVVLVPDYYEINEDLILFSKVDSKEFFPSSNDNLYMDKNGNRVKDDFSHEQYLIIKENGKNVLVSGCAHKGILNILRSAEKIIGEKIHACVSGFHLFNPGSGVSEDEDFIKNLGKELLDTNTKFYTCHCTGDEAYNILKDVLGENIEYIKTGMVFDI